MANTLGTCLSEDWEVIETDVRLHIPTLWEISLDARELNGGGRRVVLLDMGYHNYVLVGNIGDDFALDVYYSTEDEAYEDMVGVFNSFDKGNVVEL